MQRAAANQVQFVDLCSSPHQGDDALAVPVGSSVVQRRPARDATGADCDNISAQSLGGQPQAGRQDHVPSQMIFHINLSGTTQQQVETVNVSVKRGGESQKMFHLNLIYILAET